ncbi:mechanosensitive ion channel domain-containing protein [Flavobacterium chuncheonense]|uniref:Mechanosensitive ion channel domain-containing protein n=1 Tax=Flavobacterium chuncheonense TaxID=2026653 RepID=A0ABW5YHP4_9FLAO
MLKFIENPYLHEEIVTLIIIIVFFLFKSIIGKIVRKYATVNQALEHRTNLIIKYINILLGTIALTGIVIIWGVEKNQFLVFLSSVFAVVGVATVAQWSILSNITSGVILFFAYPFKIGDIIKIHDKDFPIEAEIEDIKAFYILLKTKDNEIITYPNNLLMQKGISVKKIEHETSEFTD